jgi:RimJ/RimL family protein N-acetyltransferase/anti-anti-sigma regulatory factor
MEGTDTMHLYVDGELTASIARAFCESADEALRAGDDIVIDAGNVKDVDAVGLAMLVQAGHRAAGANVRLRVVASPALHEALLDGGLLEDIHLAQPDGTLGHDRFRAVPAVSSTSGSDALVSTATMALHLPSWEDLTYFDEWAAEPMLDQMLASSLLYRCRHEGAYHADFVRRVSADPSSLTALIVPEGASRPVGFVRLYEINLVEGFAFLETAVADPRSLRRGWGIAASRLLLSYAMDVLDLQRVEAKVFGYNTLSINALVRNGFVREGCLRQARDFEGRRWDLLVFGILRDEMAAQRRRDGFERFAVWPSAASEV